MGFGSRIEALNLALTYHRQQSNPSLTQDKVIEIAEKFQLFLHGEPQKKAFGMVKRYRWIQRPMPHPNIYGSSEPKDGPTYRDGGSLPNSSIYSYPTEMDALEAYTQYHRHERHYCEIIPVWEREDEVKDEEVSA